MRRLILISTIFIAVAASGCAGNTALNARLKSMARNPQPAPEYRVAPPDNLAIEVKGYPEYSRTERVRPDGRITIPGMGDVCVQGLSIPQITDVLTAGLSKDLAHPVVTVTVVDSTSKAIYVLGEVRAPGLIPYFGDMTIIDAIATAHGVGYYGDAGKITVTRASLDNPDVINIDLDKLVQKGAAEQNLILADGDIIYVPPTPWAKFGYAIDQALFPFRNILAGFIQYGSASVAYNEAAGNHY